MLSRVVSLVVFVLGIFLIYACSSPAPSEDPAAFPLKPKSTNQPDVGDREQDNDDDDDPENPNGPTGGAGPDVTPPVIQLQGANPLMLSACQRFVDPGAMATDDRDGDVNVTVVLNFNDALQGNYQVLYQATDSAGNQTQVFRAVQVQANSIYSAADLDSVRPASSMNKNFKVCNDIDLSGTPEFVPIGSSSQKYQGVFEGANSSSPPTIRGLRINNNSTDYKGLFASLGSTAIIRNLKLENFVINSPARSYIGALAGRSEASLQNIMVQDLQITGAHEVGGLVGSQVGNTVKEVSLSMGQVQSTIQNPSGISSKTVGGLAGSVSGAVLENIQIGEEDALTDFKLTARFTGRVGGVAGSISTSHELKSLKFFGEVERLDACTQSNSNCASGGLFGEASARILDSLVISDLSIGFSYHSGGFIGRSTSTMTQILNSRAIVNLSAGYDVGGFIGYMEKGSVTSEPSIFRSYVEGVVQGLDEVGGLVGYAFKRVNISQSYSEALVTGSSRVGGIFGNAQSGGSSTTPTIENSYSVGDVVGNSQVGGLMGRGVADIINSLSASRVINASGGAPNLVNGLVGNNDGVDVDKSFWDKDINFDLDASGSGVNGSTDRTTEQLTESPVTYTGWSAIIWEIPTTSNHFYPRIKNLPNTLLKSLTEGVSQ